ncbi:carbamoyltransferase [Planctomycetota bacterium]
MKILGLHTVYHDTGACLIDGHRIIAIAEERLNRIKYSSDFPKLSIKYCLDAFGLSNINEVDLIAVDHLKDKKPQIEMDIRNAGYQGEICFVNHHDAHAASAFFCSPFDDAAILIIDGEGSLASEASSDRQATYHHQKPTKARELQSFYRGYKSDLHLIKRTYSTPSHRNGVGNLYSGYSRFLNFGKFGAGKVMGLAPYGGKSKEWHELFWEDFDGDILYPGDLKMRGDRNMKKFGKIYGRGARPRTSEELPDDVYTEIAWQCQYNCERALVAMANWLQEITQAKYICISGGVGLNSVSNQQIIDQTPFEDIFIQPACSDTGIPFGAAMYAWHKLKHLPRFFQMDNAYLGRTYSDLEIKAALLDKADRIAFEKRSDLETHVARLLTEGAIVGWHESGSETGPRALGHRSIISDPRPADARDRMNNRVKHREWWRPFAPSALEEHARQYFALKTKSPFMLLIAEVHPDKRDKVRAITHVDGTARIQTVNEKDNGRYYRLIKAFYELTGVPLILNTSFNVTGEPIVESPADALNCFLGTDIDYLVLDDYLIAKT